MTPVSKRKLSDKRLSLLGEYLLSSLENLNRKELGQILTTLLTKTELTMLKKRIGIFLLLDKQIDNERIAESVNTTRQTVARLKLQLLVTPEKNRKVFLQKLSKVNRKDAIKQLLTSLHNLESPSRSIRKIARKATGI